MYFLRGIAFFLGAHLVLHFITLQLCSKYKAILQNKKILVIDSFS